MQTFKDISAITYCSNSVKLWIIYLEYIWLQFRMLPLDSTSLTSASTLYILASTVYRFMINPKTCLNLNNIGDNFFSVDLVVFHLQIFDLPNFQVVTLFFFFHFKISRPKKSYLRGEDTNLEIVSHEAVRV